MYSNALSKLVALFRGPHRPVLHGSELRLETWAPFARALEDRVLYSASPLISSAEATDGLHVDALAMQLIGFATDDSFDVAIPVFDLGPLSDGLTPAGDAQANDAIVPGSLPPDDSGTTEHLNGSIREIVFISNDVFNYEDLIQQLNDDNTRPGLAVVVVDSKGNGFEQISAELKKYRDLDAVHLFTHGNEQGIQIGQHWMGAENAVDYAEQLSGWGQALSSSGDLLLYGCNLASDQSGRDFVAYLADVTQADVAASSNDTGHAVFGGDWILEFSIGTIESHFALSSVAQQDWLGKLATINVTTFLDVVDGNVTSVAALFADQGADGLISLREAILAVNTGAGGDTIVLGAGTYTLSFGGIGEDAGANGDLDILKNMTINGAGAGMTFIQGGGIDRVLHVVSGTTSINDLTIQGGNALGFDGGGIQIASSANMTISNSTVSGNNARNGGAIDNDGTLQLKFVTVDGNTATQNGGGIANKGSLTLANVTVSNNLANGNMGGGIEINQGSLIATNVTISGNAAGSSGGGISTIRPITLQNVTISNNTAGSGSGVFGQGLGVAEVRNSIIAGNNTSADISGIFTSLGNNLIGDFGTAVGFIHGVNGDQVGNLASPINPLLGPLQNNGGATFTHELLVGSPAINLGSLFGAPTSDQRGYLRDGSPDIGAFELAASLNLPPTKINPSAFSINEHTNTAAGVSLGVLTAIDPNVTDTFTFAIIPGLDAARFSIGGVGSNELILVDGVLDFETKSSYSAMVRVTDSAGNTYDETLTVNVVDQNDAPTNTVPAGQATGVNTPLVFSTGNGNLIAISDIDAGSSPVQVTLTTTNGTVTLNWPSGTAVPVGGEFRVNTTTPDDQFTYQNSILSGDIGSPRSVAMSSNGDFVITWSSENQDGSRWGVYAQRYNVNGTSQGSEFRVNTTTTNDQAYSTIAIDDSGNFVIAWSSKDQDGNDWGVYGQRYNAIGTALGGEFRINTFTNKSQLAPSIAMDDVGNFIVTWSSEDQDKDNWGVYAKRFNSAGVVLGGEFRVNNTTSKEQIASSVAMASDGSFVVSWSSKDQDGDNWGVYAKRYNAAGIQQGSEFLVNSVTSKKQTYSSVAMDAFGNFAVSWSSEDQDGDNWGVYAKRFNSAGVAQGSEFQVNTTTNKEQFNSSISMDSDGDFVITWTSEDQDGSGRGIYARQFTSAGVAKGGETLVNSTTAGSQDFSSVSMDAKGNFVVAWSGNGASDTQGVFAKRFSVPTGLTFSVGDGTRDTTTTFRGTMAEINAVLDGLNFSPNTGFNGLATFTITTDDLGNTSPGGALVDSDVININVGNGNVAPSISLPGVPIVYTENDPATVIDGGIVVTDPDSVNFDGGQFVVYIAGNGATADRLVIRNQGTGVGQVGVVGSNVTYNFGSGATVIGSVVGGTDGLTPLEITFNANAIVVAVQSVARNITFENVSDDPGTLSRTVEFIISDGDGGVSVNQSTTISVVELNDIPTIAPQAFNIVENATNGTLVGVVVASDPDSDANGVLSFSISGGSGASAFSIDSTTGQITVADQSQLDFEATTSFALQVQVVDGGTPGLSVTATITINLLDANESPTDLNPNGYSVVENTNTAGGFSLGVLTAIDQDASESFTYSILAGGDGALFSIGGAGANELILTDGVLNFETKSSYSVTVRVLDSAGSSYDEILTVNVIDQDEIPVAAAGGPYIINEGNGVVLNGLASADPEGSALSYSWDLNNDGVFGDAVGATPSINWGSLNSFGITNQGIFAIGLRVADGAGNSNTTTTTLTVNNLAPTAINDSGASFTTSEDNLFVTGNVLLNDSDPNGHDALSIVGLDLTGTRGLVVYNGDGTFTYNPNGQFEALQLGDTAFDTFIYTLRDEAGATAFGTVTVSIRGVNDEQQLIINQNLIVLEGAAQSFSSTNLITIDVDNTALELTYAITNGPARGFLSLNTNPTVAVTTFTQAQINSGVVIYVHNGSETLSDSFGFTVDDGMGSLSSGTFAITVSPVNDMPVSVADNYTASPGIAMIVGGAGVLQNDIDIDSTAFTAMVVSGPINGQLVLQVDGSFTYLPDVNFFGIDSFTYTVSDGVLTSLPAMVRIEVAQPSPTITPSTTPFPTPTDGSESVVVEVQPEPVSTAAAQGQVQRTTQTAAEPASAIQVHSISTDPNAATGTITAEALESMVESEWLEYLLQASSRGSRFRVDGQTVLTEMGFVTQTGSFWESLDGFKRNAEAIATAPALMIGGSAVLATSISAGYLVWMIRGGQVLAAMMANLPAWQLMDPLPILGGWVEKDDETDKSLESLLEESTDSNVLLESNVTEGSPSVVAT